MGIESIHQDFVCGHQIPLKELNKRTEIEVIDGRPIEAVDSMHIAKVGMEIQDPEEQLPMVIMKLGHHPGVLQIASLQLHDVAVRSLSSTVTFGSK